MDLDQKKNQSCLETRIIRYLFADIRLLLFVWRYSFADIRLQITVTQGSLNTGLARFSRTELMITYHLFTRSNDREMILSGYELWNEQAFIKCSDLRLPIVLQSLSNNFLHEVLIDFPPIPKRPPTLLSNVIP